MQRKYQQTIQERQNELKELREAVESHKRSAQTAVEDSERIFTELIRSIERSRSEVTQLIRDREKAAVSRAEEQMEQMEQEIEDLRRRDAELEQLLHTDHHIHFLQSFQSLSVPPETTDTPSITVSSHLSFDDVGKSVSDLRERLEHFCRDEIEKMHGKAKYIETIPTAEFKTRDEFLQYSSAAERTEKQKQLGEMQSTYQQRIQERERELEELREAVESHKCSAQTALEDNERIFTELIRSIERSRSEVTQLIRDQEKAEVSRAEEQMERLEQEIKDLRRRDAELEQLSYIDHHIHFFQSFLSLSVPPESTDTPSITVSSRLSFDDVSKSVSHLREKLEHFCREEVERIHDRAKYIEIITTPECKTRDEFLQYFFQFTVDSNTESPPPTARGKMGGKLSKKKKGYNVNDEKAKEKDAKTEGASAEEGEAPKENKEDAPAATETTNDTAAAAKEATPTAESNSTAPKEEEKNAAPAKKEEPAANAKASDAKASEPAKAEPAKSPDAPPAKAEEKSATSAAPANEKEPAPAAKDPAPPVATATESKPDAESKKTEAPPAKESTPAEPITTESSPAPNKEQAVAVQD
ncbi:hypothetical protein Q8A67_008738 [Cirrhinus molitorella]|uniref:TRIM8/14/16/25/29/45/65 coiled-coil region domain-containing protein n=1 Tax=Cirrhinus molitorella TaxID=172907 RepID=A0AA88PTF6_9TELE|nr:hypothetical protein Q8A67_008738 [Cirrhinus molitorella]